MAKETEDKQGFTVQEIENMAKKYRFEAFFCVSFVLAAIFSWLFTMWGWSIFLCALGGIVGMLIPLQIDKGMGWVLSFTCKQEKITQIIIGVVLLVISIVLCPVIFIILGLMGGKSLHKDSLHHKGQHLHSNLDETHHEE
ncbi:MAG: hypothetical protein P0S95_02660 [Rhabdochlamydiaceae bacterium]|nr:hypothetical protein [Candidatus Amphrikana amoebophyrae]